ncbi:nucleoside phosphorylase [Sesbania bispinosa]|nr:nucleoside phosphorylase [Sesbania bispinosa]
MVVDGDAAHEAKTELLIRCRNWWLNVDGCSVTTVAVQNQTDGLCSTYSDVVIPGWRRTFRMETMVVGFNGFHPSK